MSRNSHRQRGFSLVELMVAMVIALILLAGILQILLGNRESFRYQQNMASLQENSRLASFVIEHVVAHAGYRADLDAQPFRSKTDNSNKGADYAANAVVAGADNGDDSDVLRTRFQAAGGIHDCQGREIGTTGTTPIYELADVEFYVNENKTLLCQDYSGGGSKISQPIVEQVERFNVVYGVDTNDDNSADTYVHDLNEADATNVVSLRVQLLLRSEKNVLPTAVRRTFEFASGPPFETKGGDRHAYQFIDQVVALRNLLP